MQEVEKVAKTGHYLIAYKGCLLSLTGIEYGFQIFIIATGFHHISIISVYACVIFPLLTSDRVYC